MAQKVKHQLCKHLLFFVLAIGCILPTAAPGIAATYYVAPDGDNGNLGTLDSPWATVEYGYTTVSPGDTVYFRQGTYVLADLVRHGPHGTSEAERTTF